MSTKRKKESPPLTGIPMSHTAYLLETRMFRLALALPILASLLLFSVALFYSWDTLKMCGSTECFNNFFTHFKFQIAIMGLAIPLGALVASHHRSVQAAHQIEQQSNQNAFSNHIEHRNLFFEFAKEEKPFGKLSFDANRVYEAIFSESVDGKLAPSEEVISQSVEIVSETTKTIDEHLLPEFSNYHFRITSQKAIGALNEYKKQLNDKLSVRLPVGGDTLKAFPNNNFEDIRKLAQQLGQTASGIGKCSNFHRSHIDPTIFDDTAERVSLLWTKLNELQAPAHAHKAIMENLRELVDDSGDLIEPRMAYGAPNFLREFERVEENCIGLYGDKENMLKDVQKILDIEFSQPAVNTLTQYFPADWLIYIRG